MENKYDVFISYSRKDTRIADKICEVLDARGIKYFIDRKGVYSGDQFLQVLAESILNSQLFLLLCSRNSYESEYTQKEINFAIQQKRTIIPYIIDDFPMPPLYRLAFANLNYREMKSFSPDELAKDLNEMLSGNTILEPHSDVKKWYERRHVKIGAISFTILLLLSSAILGYHHFFNSNQEEVEEVIIPDGQFLDCKGKPLEGESDIIPGTFQHLVDCIRVGSSEMLHDEKGNGYDVVTTIDLGLQLEAQNAILPTLQDVDASKGMMVVMDVKTGDIRAMVNLTKTRNGYYEMDNDALSYRFEPGSAFIPASIMVALEDGKVRPSTEVDTGNGLWKVYGSTVKDWSYGRGGFGVITVDSIVAWSSNVGVAKIITEHYGDNPERFLQGLSRIGINLPSELGRYISGVQESRTKSPVDDTWANTSLPWISFGYESLYTPLNILTFYNAIANGGKMVRPRIIKSIKRGDATVRNFNIEISRKAICSPWVNDSITAMLRNCVDSETGTGKRSYSPIFGVCAKTFSAQMASERGGYNKPDYYIGICGFFPADNPKYSCIVSIIKNGLPASAGSLCGPIFHDFAESIYSKYVRNQQ